ncbi:MAG: hypothetical protein HY327_02390 [Chloroflexi bacterium]|nr:hypothetical protein [Chloroflexota bacterium]
MCFILKKGGAAMSAEEPTTRGPAKLIAEHYQRTYELTSELRKDRNRIFLILVGFLALATLLFSLGQTSANSLLVRLVAKLLDLTDVKEIDALKTNINFDLLQTMVLAVVFYLTVNLYHHTTTVLRHYAYLGKLETEIRDALGLDAKSISFTREGAFYSQDPSFWLRLVGKVYVLILFVLLGGFLVLHLTQDVQAGFSLFTVADVAIALAIAGYFFAFSTASFKF